MQETPSDFGKVLRRLMLVLAVPIGLCFIVGLVVVLVAGDDLAEMADDTDHVEPLKEEGPRRRHVEIERSESEEAGNAPDPAEKPVVAHETKEVRKLRILVVHEQGRPLCGVPIAVGWRAGASMPREPTGHTDVEGRLEVPLTEELLENPGGKRWKLRAGFTGRVLSELAREVVLPEGDDPVDMKFVLPGSVVRARVVEGARPVPGVPVKLVGQMRGRSGDLDVATSVTGAAGVADVLAPTKLMEMWSQYLGALDEHVRFEVKAGAVTKPVELVIGGWTEVTVDLAVLGGLDIALSHADGTPFEEDVRKVWMWARAAPGEDRWKNVESFLREKGEGGVWRLRGLRTGRDLKIALDFRGRARVETVASGPASPGDVERLELTVPPRWPRVFGKLATAGGQPVTGAISVQWGDRGTSSACDAYGRFVVTAALGDEPADSLEILTNRTNHEGRAEVALAAPLAVERDVDLGTIVLEPYPVALAGRVVDDAGDPIAGVRFKVMEARARGTHLAGGTRLRDVVSGEGGRFEVRAAFRTKRLLTRGRHPAVRRGRPVEGDQTLGDTDAVVTFPRPEPEAKPVVRTRVFIPVTLDDGFGISDLDMSVRTRTTSRGPNVHPGGFSLDNPEPGPATWEIKATNMPVLQGAFDIPVPTKEGVTMEAIDLRGRLKKVTFAFTDVAGAPLKDLKFYLLQGPMMRKRSQADGEGVAVFTVPAEVTKLAVKSRGYRMQEVALGGGRTTVALEKE